MQDGPAYNHLRYTQDSIPTNLYLTLTSVHSLIRTNQTHHPRKSPLCFQKYLIISIGRLLICIVLRIPKT